MDVSDAGDQRHENVYGGLPDGMAVLGSARPLPATMSTAPTTLNRLETYGECAENWRGFSGASLASAMGASAGIEAHMKMHNIQ